jgi:hypothetical protein
MFANIAFASPIPGKEKEMAEVMHNFAKTLQGSAEFQAGVYP